MTKVGEDDAVDMTKLPHLAVLAIHFFLAAVVNTVSHPAQAESAGTPIRFAVMSLVPYGFKDADGNWRGNHHDLVSTILESGGFDGSVEVLPVARLTAKMFKEKTLDCAIFANVPFVRQNYAKVAPLHFGMVFGALPTKDVRIGRYDDLKNLHIAVPLGTNMGQPFDDDETLTKVRVRGYEFSTSPFHLRSGRVLGLLSRTCTPEPCNWWATKTRGTMNSPSSYARLMPPGREPNSEWPCFLRSVRLWSRRASVAA